MCDYRLHIFGLKGDEVDHRVPRRLRGERRPHSATVLPVTADLADAPTEGMGRARAVEERELILACEEQRLDCRATDELGATKQQQPARRGRHGAPSGDGRAVQPPNNSSTLHY
eukprot:scaffold31254_cov39-Tisochrysis_lutea.AAC.2